MTSDGGGVSALQVALAAGILLVAVVGADVALNRTVSLQVETDDGWQTLTQLPPERASYSPHGTLIEVNRSDDVTFRVQVDNQRLDAFEGSYEIRQHGERIARGQVTADRLGVGTDAFTVTADTLMPDPGDGEDRPPRPVGTDLEMLVDGETGHAWLDVQEVPR